MRHRFLATVVILALACGLFPLAKSMALSGENESAFQKLAATKINLVDAIHEAEKAADGRAVSAEFELDDGDYVFEVEVLSSNGEVTEVEIDPMTGAVLEIERDAEDGDDDGD